MKKKRSVFVFVILTICICSLSACSHAPRVTEFSDINEYGKIIGTGTLKSNYRAKKEFYSFFPSVIDPSFEDVKYHYKAIDNYTYAFEASLEFKLPDDKSFFAYVESVAPTEEFKIFPYDEEYLEYLPEKNSLSLYEPEPGEADEGEGTEYYSIEHARIKRVLINPSDRKILYVLVRVSEDYRTKTTDLDDFFSRFQIDPKEFACRLQESEGRA